MRSYKKSNELSIRLAKEGLPEHYKYDSRLIGADADSFEKVLKTVKSEYEATQPKGNQHSSVVQTGANKGNNGGSDKEEIYSEVGKAIGQLIGK